jgi:membrane-associated phospholipid phosphatase
MEIDCSVYCPIFLKMLNSCPSKNLSIRSLDNNDELFEILMVLLSVSPYVVSFLILVSIPLFKTTRSAFILLMIFGQNFIIEILKGSLRDPRPNFKCNQQFGNPSNHATFYSSLATWILMEHILLDAKFRFKYASIKLLLFVSYPFILYSRIYLKYHSGEQVIL